MPFCKASWRTATHDQKVGIRLALWGIGDLDVVDGTSILIEGQNINDMELATIELLEKLRHLLEVSVIFDLQYMSHKLVVGVDGWQN